MKKLFVTLALASFTAGAFAQATLGGLDFPNSAKPVFNTDGVTKLTGTGFTAQLFIGPAGINQGSNPAADDAGLAAALDKNGVAITKASFKAGIVALTGSVQIQGTTAGSTYSLQLRVWDNKGGTVNSWADVLKDSSIARGESATWQAKLGGVDAGGNPVLNAKVADGISSFSLQIVPEPSVIALGALGLGALVLRRRK